jgi:hypothetical protein
MEFIDAIETELKEGWGFMPMLGSGISVPSGIPTAAKFPPYFMFCLDKALTEEIDPHLWDWPSFSVVKRARTSPTGAPEKIWQELQAKLNKAITNLSRKKLDADAREGKRILEKLQPEKLQEDWRLGMECLSRLFNSDEMMGYRDLF